ncbi:hypothetical protein D9M71_828000 [compost metagenome]
MTGAQSAPVEPVVITPSCSSTTLKVLAPVNTSAHLPSMAPLLVISGGWFRVLYWAVVALPMGASVQLGAPLFQVCWVNQ